MLTIVFCLLLAASTNAATDSFFIAPVTTDLQQDEIGAGIQIYAIVNCSALIIDGKVDLKPLAPEAFVKRLADHFKPGDRLKLVCRFQLQADVKANLRKQVHAKLVSLCKKAGFEKINRTEVRTSASWNDAVVRTRDFNETEDASESVVEDDLVRVFPIRTKLSQFLNGSHDCIVEVIRPIDGRMTELPPELIASITKAVDPLN